MGLFHHVLVYMGDGKPTVGPSCTEFVFPGCWHFDNDTASKIDDVFTEHGGLLHVLPLAVHLKFFLLDKGWWGGVVAHEILVSVLRGLGPGLDNISVLYFETKRR